jgi:GMP synthase (glutamine-hydrolysing)
MNMLSWSVVTLCVQGDCRSYSYVVGLSSEKEPDWGDMLFLARLIPRVCHNVNRVCYIWGGLVRDQVLDITPTFLTSNVLSTLRQVDHVANQVSKIKMQVVDYSV